MSWIPCSDKEFVQWKTTRSSDKAFANVSICVLGDYYQRWFDRSPKDLARTKLWTSTQLQGIRFGKLLCQNGSIKNVLMKAFKRFQQNQPISLKNSWIQLVKDLASLLSLVQYSRRNNWFLPRVCLFTARDNHEKKVPHVEITKPKRDCTTGCINKLQVHQPQSMFKRTIYAQQNVARTTINTSVCNYLWHVYENRNNICFPNRALMQSQGN